MTRKLHPDSRDILTPADVGHMFGVNSKTVTRWAQQGKLPSITTPGGHRRFKRSDVEKWIEEHRTDAREREV